MAKDYQHIFLYMDDSGKISKMEEIAVFGGIVFKNSDEKMQFTNKYRSIINQIQNNYSSFNSHEISNQYIEIKGNNISNPDRRRIMQLSKQFLSFATIIYNHNLKPEILARAPTKGRFTEYAQRRIIKKSIQELITENAINPKKDIYLHVNIDEMPTKTNGYYNLREGLIEELKYGIINWDYGTNFSPIVFGDLQVEVIYRDSKKDLGIQMADIIANTIRRAFIFNNNWYDTYEYISKKLGINVILRLPN